MKRSLQELGKRERQIAELVYQLGEASVAELIGEMPDPPSYSTVRAMMGRLVAKGILKFRQDGKRYIYRPAVPRDRASRSAMRKLLSTFFAGQPSEAMAALLDVSGKELSGEDLARMKRLIDQAEREVRP